MFEHPLYGEPDLRMFFKYKPKRHLKDVVKENLKILLISDKGWRKKKTDNRFELEKMFQIKRVDTFEVEN